ncbi:hypothetical protein Bca4012_050464 [Brassica carinata]
MLSPAAEVFGMDCDVTDGPHAMIYFENKKTVYSQKLRATRKILQDQERCGEKLANQQS